MLIAMNALSQPIVWTGFAACLLMMGFGLFAPCRRGNSAAGRGWWSVVALATVVFPTAWLWLVFMLGLLAWGLWIGDNNHWFYDHLRLIAAALAAPYTGFVAYRVLARPAARYYFRVLFWGYSALLLLFGGLLFSEWASRIYGTTARSAAENVFRGMDLDPARQGLQLIEEQRHGLDHSGAPTGVTFLIAGPEEPRGRITVCRYGWFWWTVAGSQRYPPSKEELARAKKWLGGPVNRDHAPEILRNIVLTYPGTEAAREAQQLLDGLEKEKRLRPERSDQGK